MRHSLLSTVYSPTDAQIAESLSDTRDILEKCKQICIELDLPVAMVEITARVFHEQLHAKCAKDDNDARWIRNRKEAVIMRKLGTSPDFPNLRSPIPDLGMMSDEEIDALMDSHGLKLDHI